MARPQSALEIVRTRSLTSLVQQEIESMILSGRIKAGERLNEQVLAAKLGVSRGPVREATRGLERAGLVTAVVNYGVYVRKVSREEAFELYDLRALLTGFACQRLAETASGEQRRHLSNLVSRMDAAARSGNSTTYYALNLEFHDALMRFAGNGRAKQIDESLIKEMHLFRQRSLVAPANMLESNAEHQAIVAAIGAGDAEAARRAGETHVRGGRRRFSGAVPEIKSAGPPMSAGPSTAKRPSKGGNHEPATRQQPRRRS
ncbi:MAG: FCD domain-containing protein [Alphaproteobacteria bacterium]|nr:FCD domain-containing protein [Alphaproteobacteria bacterium]